LARDGESVEDTSQENWRIAKKYLETWFVPDVVASIPVTLIELGAGIANQKSLGSLTALKTLRLLKLLRLVRALGQERFLAQAMMKGYVRPASVTLAKLVFVFFYVLHLQACGFWAVAAAVGM
jgi:hypothetical protein